VVGFHIPRWLVLRARPKSGAGLAADADVGENAGTP
jgi:hypothetical protein